MELYHKDKFKDVKDVLIRGTKTRVSRTQQNEQLVAWMKRTNRIPISYMRDSNGIHVECSEVFERKIRHALKNGSAIGMDGRKYLFKDTDDLFPIGSDICVMAAVEGSEHYEAYGLDFFV